MGIVGREKLEDTMHWGTVLLKRIGRETIQVCATWHYLLSSVDINDPSLCYLTLFVNY